MRRWGGGSFICDGIIVIKSVKYKKICGEKMKKRCKSIFLFRGYFFF